MYTGATVFAWCALNAQLVVLQLLAKANDFACSTQAWHNVYYSTTLHGTLDAGKRILST
jgi:hypothetical protein